MNPVHFSSKTDEWATPHWLFDELNQEFGFTLDVCATRENRKCPAYYTRENDALRLDWTAQYTCFDDGCTVNSGTGPVFHEPAVQPHPQEVDRQSLTNRPRGTDCGLPHTSAYRYALLASVHLGLRAAPTPRGGRGATTERTAQIWRRQSGRSIPIGCGDLYFALR